MAATPTNVRFPDDLNRRVAEHARRSGTAKSKVVLTAVDEWLRLQEHPGVRFATTNNGERRARLVAGPEVWTVAESWQQHDLADRTAALVADALGLTAAQVEAALAYWADNRDEIDRLIALHHEAQDEALRAWERRQALG